MRSLAVTCPRRSLAVTCGSAQPLAVTCGHSSGCKWLQVADFSKIKYRVTCSRRSLAVTRVAARGGLLRSLALGGLLRSLAVTRVAAGSARPLAVTCGHSSGCKWLQVADFSKIKYRVTCSRRSLAVTQVAASGCKWLIFPKSNTAQLACSMITENNIELELVFSLRSPQNFFVLLLFHFHF